MGAATQTEATQAEVMQAEAMEAEAIARNSDKLKANGLPRSGDQPVCRVRVVRSTPRILVASMD